MGIPLDEAVRVIENFLVDFRMMDDLDASVATIIASADPEAMELVSTLMSVSPRPQHLDALWALADRADADEAARVEALRSVTGLLLDAQEDLAWDFGEEPTLSKADFEGHCERLLDAYRSEDRPKLVRRRALEWASNLLSTEEVVEAGRIAHASNDPDWIVTGLLVRTLTEPEQGRTAAYEALDHENTEVRLQAIRGLAILGEVEDIDALGRVARSGGGPELSAALEALTNLSDGEAGQVLYDLTEQLTGAENRAAEDAYEEWLESWAGIGDHDDDEDWSL